MGAHFSSASPSRIWGRLVPSSTVSGRTPHCLSLNPSICHTSLHTGTQEDFLFQVKYLGLNRGRIYKHNHSSFIQNSPKLETTWVSINRSMNKHNSNIHTTDTTFQGGFHFLSIKGNSLWYTQQQQWLSRRSLQKEVRQRGYLRKCIYVGAGAISIQARGIYHSQMVGAARKRHEGNFEGVKFCVFCLGCVAKTEPTSSRQSLGTPGR